MIYFTELENLPVYDVKGEFVGILKDLGVDPSQDALRVAAYMVKTPGKRMACITHQQMQSVSVRAGQTSVPAEEVRCYGSEEMMLRVKKDVLDQQIIDVNQRKVVRVNDVDFDITPADGCTELRILAVNIGLGAAVRRLLQGLMAKHTLRRLAGVFPSKTIPWGFVNLIEPDPARRVKLRISNERLAKLHPADIADILEELSRDEQRAVIESLDDETAAEAISEIPTKMQADLIESMPAEKAADVLEEMPPDEAADVLQELPPETSAVLLADMEKEEAREVRELLGFERDTAGALMTTDYIVVGESATVEGAVAAVKSYEGSPESVHAIFLIDSSGVLGGSVTLARLLVADFRTPLKELAGDGVISIGVHADHKAVIDLFQKYNLVVLPVVDERGFMLGVVTADDVLDLMVKHR